MTIHLCNRVHSFLGQNLTPRPQPLSPFRGTCGRAAWPSLQGKGESGSPPRFGEGLGEGFVPNVNGICWRDLPASSEWAIFNIQ